MRALIRADLHPSLNFQQLWSDRNAYNEQVVRLFLEMGYAAVKTGQVDLEKDATVEELIKDIPPDIKEQETGHLIMLGYTSEGQSHFLVTGVNPTEVHIRVKGRLYGRLRRACVDIYKNAERLKKRRQKRKSLLLLKNDSKGILITPYLILRKTIEVMEPLRDHPTIRGEIIESALSEVVKDNRNEVVLIIFTLVGSVFLFFATPYLAPVLQTFLVKFLNVVGYSKDYIQGALERTYSAFLVSFAVTLLTVLTKAFEISRFKPIRWDTDTDKIQTRK